MSAGLLGYASYLPRHRLPAAAIGLRKGDRVVASYDEDSTTMAVAAAGAALAPGAVPAALYLATTSPAYVDKTNATAVHAALGLPAQVFSADLCGTGRSTIAALKLAAQGGGLVVAADVRVGKPGSADEKTGGDGAAALWFGDGEPIARIVALRSQTAEFLDRWREPTSVTGQQWEERFGAEQYSALIRSTARAALDDAGIADADHVVLACPNTAIIKRAATLVKGQKSVSTSPIGHAGAADALIALAGVLDGAAPGDSIVVISAVDGCDVVVLQTTAALAAQRQARPLADQRSAGLPVEQLTYLSWRGLVELEAPRRPEPERAAAPPAARSAGWKFGFTGARCDECGFTHLPPVRVCRSCTAVDAMTALPVAQLTGTVVTYTVDRLAFSPSPPMVQAVVDIEGGGRCTLEVADARPDDLEVGARVRFSFRRLFTAGGVHDYFWKAVQEDAQ
ncbi:OB-fold domain-containing protein [Mycolicibacterium sp. P9-22]|uniref:OB-fold domain-containing protein n=1 Tax=Mycolicibacterium sp. P9-22 TaxID=2024613 RepID=UPI0011EF6BB4|nr:OB-fold domain-containing protein [Mycolicibacterium sp. P9-22]KAA0120918.1 hydroxymethylglutaryl-CoA synthase family protein [Mycolicibacterium sp. P9-22]